MASDSVKYRPYPSSLNTKDVEGLFDVDEDYPDIVQTLLSLQGTSLFITGWLIVPSIRLSASETLQDMLIGELKKPNSKVYILWNTNYNGTPYPKLKTIAGDLYAAVTKASGATKDRLKIILSTNLQFDPPGMLWDEYDDFVRARWAHDRLKHLLEWKNPDATLPANATESMAQLWLKSFPSDPKSYKNLTAFTFGSHHQKTLTVIGTNSGGKKVIRAYCGGIDFATGPAGYEAAKHTYNGGTWWHDSAMRVTGANAKPVLANFVERWSADLPTVTAGKTLAFGVADSDALDVATLTAGVDMTTSSSGSVVSRRTMPLGGVDFPLVGATRVIETLDTYKTWIAKAKDRVFVTNQYFRYKPIADLLKQRLDSQANLHVTIVFPMYTEEIGQRRDLVALRQLFVATAAAARGAVLTKVKASALTIDPINKLTLFAQSQALKELVVHPQVSVWMPKAPLGIPYIHSKMVLFDVQALMIGSANLNGRSLLGLADSEINLLLTDTAEITRIRDAQKWHLEPANEFAANYPGSWYATHNLARYTADYWTVDNEFGTFPKGRANIHDYATKMKVGGRFDLKGVTFDPKEIDSALDLSGLDPDTTDFGDLFLKASEHLL